MDVFWIAQKTYNYHFNVTFSRNCVSRSWAVYAAQVWHEVFFSRQLRCYHCQLGADIVISNLGIGDTYLESTQLSSADVNKLAAVETEKKFVAFGLGGKRSISLRGGVVQTPPPSRVGPILPSKYSLCRPPKQYPPRCWAREVVAKCCFEGMFTMGWIKKT